MRYLAERKKGFTLIEMLIYIAFLAITSIIATTSLFTIMRATTEIRLAQDVNNSASDALGRIVREIRDAHGIDVIQSDFGVNPGRLVLDTKDASGSDITVDFHLDSGALKVWQDALYQGSLTASNIQVTNLVFTNITTANSHGIKIDLELVGTRGNLTKTQTYYATTILRGEY